MTVCDLGAVTDGYAGRYKPVWWKLYTSAALLFIIMTGSCVYGRVGLSLELTLLKMTTR